MIYLAPFPNGRGQHVLVPVETLGSYFWTFVCEADGAASGNKIFISEMGVEALMNPAARDTVTGAVVLECAAFSLVIAA